MKTQTNKQRLFFSKRTSVDILFKYEKSTKLVPSKQRRVKYESSPRTAGTEYKLVDTELTRGGIESVVLYKRSGCNMSSWEIVNVVGRVSNNPRGDEGDMLTPTFNNAPQQPRHFQMKTLSRRLRRGEGMLTHARHWFSPGRIV